MIKAAFITLHTDWPWMRQLPAGEAEFQGVKFFVPVSDADIIFVYDALPESPVTLRGSAPVVFVASEPENVKRYNPRFLSQFDAVVTSDRHTPHPNRIFVQAGLHWHAGIFGANGHPLPAPMSFEDFERHEPRKTRLVSVVSSDKAFTEQHRARLAFVALLKEAFGERIDVFGRGIVDFADKRDVLDEYRYHIALENCTVDDYWTEKLADPYLTLTFPIYHGCPNIADYFPDDALQAIDIYKPKEAIEIIRAVIGSDLAERRRDSLLEARRRVMHDHNVFGMLAKVAAQVLQHHAVSREKRVRVLYQEKNFVPTLLKMRSKVVSFLERHRFFLRCYLRIKYYNVIMKRRARHMRLYACSDFYRAHQNWVSDHPAEEIRYDYNLPSGANVLDVGGYVGEFAGQFIQRFNANVTVFEPVPNFAAQIKRRFSGDPRVSIYEAGLSDKDEMVEFDLDADASGAFGMSDGDKIQVPLWDAEKFLSSNSTRYWHLAKLNIEGGEYALLKRLIETGRIETIQNLQVQFHLHVPGARKRYRELAKGLQRTHKLQWRYPFVWESWTRREDMGR